MCTAFKIFLQPPFDSGLWARELWWFSSSPSWSRHRLLQEGPNGGAEHKLDWPGFCTGRGTEILSAHQLLHLHYRLSKHHSRDLRLLRLILTAYQEAMTSKQPSWRCATCHVVMKGSFPRCWKCGHEWASCYDHTFVPIDQRQTSYNQQTGQATTMGWTMARVQFLVHGVRGHAREGSSNRGRKNNRGQGTWQGGDQQYSSKGNGKGQEQHVPAQVPMQPFMPFPAMMPQFQQPMMQPPLPPPMIDKGAGKGATSPSSYDAYDWSACTRYGSSSSYHALGINWTDGSLSCSTLVSYRTCHDIQTGWPSSTKVKQTFEGDEEGGRQSLAAPAVDSSRDAEAGREEQHQEPFIGSEIAGGGQARIARSRERTSPIIVSMENLFATVSCEVERICCQLPCFRKSSPARSPDSETCCQESSTSLRPCLEEGTGWTGRDSNHLRRGGRQRCSRRCHGGTPHDESVQRIHQGMDSWYQASKSSPRRQFNWSSGSSAPEFLHQMATLFPLLRRILVRPVLYDRYVYSPRAMWSACDQPRGDEAAMVTFSSLWKGLPERVASTGMCVHVSCWYGFFSLAACWHYFLVEEAAMQLWSCSLLWQHHSFDWWGWRHGLFDPLQYTTLPFVISVTSLGSYVPAAPSHMILITRTQKWFPWWPDDPHNHLGHLQVKSRTHHLHLLRPHQARQWPGRQTGDRQFWSCWMVELSLLDCHGMMGSNSSSARNKPLEIKDKVYMDYIMCYIDLKTSCSKDFNVFLSKLALNLDPQRSCGLCWLIWRSLSQMRCFQELSSDSPNGSRKPSIGCPSSDCLDLNPCFKHIPSEVTFGTTISLFPWIKWALCILKTEIISESSSATV